MTAEDTGSVSTQMPLTPTRRRRGERALGSYEVAIYVALFLVIITA